MDGLETGLVVGRPWRLADQAAPSGPLPVFAHAWSLQRALAEKVMASSTTWSSACDGPLPRRASAPGEAARDRRGGQGQRLTALPPIRRARRPKIRAARSARSTD